MAVWIRRAAKDARQGDRVRKGSTQPSDYRAFVMARLDPAIHVLLAVARDRTWMPGTSSAKTRFALQPGHDDGWTFA